MVILGDLCRVVGYIYSTSGKSKARIVVLFQFLIQLKLAKEINVSLQWAKDSCTPVNISKPHCCVFRQISMFQFHDIG